MINLNLWLDDYRKPPSFESSGLLWIWVKTADEAIEALKAGKVQFASLDHDLAEEHYYAYEHPQDVEDKGFREKTGYEVLVWMRENSVWPVNGVRIHTANSTRRPIMLSVVHKQYGRWFQHLYVTKSRLDNEDPVDRF